MRKFTILLAMLAFATFAFGQKGFVPYAASLSKAEPMKKIKKQQKNDFRNSKGILWYEDFSGTNWSATSEEGIAQPQNAPAGWQLLDYTGSGYFFRWDTVGPRGLFTSPGDEDLYCYNPSDPLLSTSGDNGFMMLEADFYNSLPDCSAYTGNGMNTAIIYNVPIDFSDHTSIHLVFEQMARYCCSYSGSSDSWFEVSTDGGETWTAKSVHESGINAYTENAEVSDFDISPMVAGEESVIFRFRLQGLSHYHWEIDDIRFIVPAANDMVMLDYWNQYISAYQLGADEGPLNSAGDFVEGFYHYPWFMTQNFVGFNAAFVNFGANDLTNVTHNVKITKNGQDLVSYAASPVASSVVGQQDTTQFAQEWSPEGKGVYEFIHYVTTTEGDDDHSTDTLKRAFVIGDTTICPVDTTAISTRMSPDNWTNHVDGRGLGFFMSLPEPSLHGDGVGTDKYTVSGVRVYLAKQVSSAETLIASGDASFTAELYKLNDDDGLDLIIQSSPRVLTLDDTASYIYLPFQTNGTAEVLLAGGDFVVNIAFWGTWTDPYGRTASYDIGEANRYKHSWESCMLVDPLGADFGGVSGGGGPSIALGISFDDAYVNTEQDVTFTVTDASSAGVDAATIFVGSKQGTTDASGVAIVTLEDGDYTYRVEADGFGDYEGDVSVSGAAEAVSVTLSTEYEVKFELKNSNGDLIQGATIEIGDEELITNTAGVDSVNFIPGSYDYTITKFGYTELTGSVDVVDGDVFEQIANFNKETFTLDFTVQDETSAAIDGATITINGGDLTTDVNGAATATGLTLGTYAYTITYDGYATYVGSVTVSEDASLLVSLEPIYTVTITVNDIDGNLVEGATVTIGEDFTGTTDVNGVVASDFIDGTYAVTATKEGYLDATADVTVDGADEAATLSLTKVYKVTFNVVDENADPIVVSITFDGTEYFTNASGQLIIEDLLVGDYDYLAYGNRFQQQEGTITIVDADVVEDIELRVGISTVNSVDFDIYPNPTNGQFNIDVNGVAHVTILNTVGEVVETMKISGSQLINLDLASGVYFVRVKEGTKVGTKQLIIE